VHADSASEARAHYDRALKFYEDGVFDAALVELTRAYELNPSYRILYNIAQTRVAMRDYAGAIQDFQRYLREGGGQVPNQRVNAVRAQIDELQQRVGKLTIETDVPDSEVLIDDVVVGVAPLPGPVTVNAGMRRVSVRNADYATHTQRVSLAGGEQRRVVLNLRAHDSPPPLAATEFAAPAQTAAASSPAALPPRAATPLTAAPAQPAGTAGPSHTAAWIGSGVTVAFTATAVVLGVVALDKNGDLADKRDLPGQDEAAFDRERASMNRLAIMTDVFGVAAAVAAGVTTWLWLRDGSSERARVAIGPTGVHGRF
jgi:hypothetical protein